MDVTVQVIIWGKMCLALPFLVQEISKYRASGSLGARTELERDNTEHILDQQARVRVSKPWIRMFLGMSEERLASCIMYHAGNGRGSTNPTYAIDPLVIHWWFD